jgi:hypothetical protein
MNIQGKIIFFWLFITGMALTKNTTAQQGDETYRLQGMIADSVTKQPQEGITVYLQKDSNSYLKTSITKKDGSFSFSNLKPLNYHIRISSVGYNSKTLEVAIALNANSVLDLGTIYISNKVSNLNEVVVKASPPLVTQDIDKISYHMEADPESKGTNVLEMMRKVPFLSIDGNNNILLNGSSSYRIFLNGRPSALFEKNAREILRSMPASTIKSIEVITNPSSKYDGEGLAGIINIITHKKISSGYNGTINMNHKSPIGGAGAGGTFSFKSGKLGMMVLGGTSNNRTPHTEGSIHRTSMDNNATNLEQNNARSSDGRSRYIGSEISFELDSLRLISAQFNYNDNKLSSFGSKHTNLKNLREVIQSYDVIANGKGNGNGMDAALNYQMGFKSNKERLLTFSYRYLRNRNEQVDKVFLINKVNFESPDYNQANTGSFLEQTFQADYVQQVKTLAIETGVKAILRNNESNYQFLAYDSLNGKFELDVNRTNNYKNQQHIFAAYNTYQYKIKNWGFKAGVRIEYTTIDAAFVSDNTQAKQNYLNIIPAATIGRKLKDKSSITLSFTNRIQRPAIYQLNPFVDRSNPAIESSGNPNLKPGYTNLIQLSYLKSKKATFNVALTYMLLNNLINPVSVYDTASKITRTRFENAGKARILKTNIFLNYPVNENWTVRLNSDIRYITANVIVAGKAMKNDGLMTYFNISNGYRFTKGWRLNADVTLNSGGISGIQSKTNGFIGSSFSVQKGLLKDKLTISGTVNNPFTKYRNFREEIVGTGFTQLTRNEIYYRSFNLSLNYSFGKLKSTIKKNKRSINNDDVEFK